MFLMPSTVKLLYLLVLLLVKAFVGYRKENIIIIKFHYGILREGSEDHRSL